MTTDKTIHILVVDRSPDTISESIAEAVSSGYAVITASTVETAVRCAGQCDIALVIMDVDPYGAEGFDFVDAMLNLNGSSPCVLLLSESWQADMEKKRTECDACIDYLPKPVDMKILKKLTGLYVKMHRQKKITGETQALLESETRLRKSAEEKLRLNCGCLNHPGGVNDDVPVWAGEQKKEVMHQVRRTVSALAGGISHQFNNNLNVIAGHAELLKIDYPGDANVTMCGNRIIETVKFMSGLTEKLQAYAMEGNYYPQQLSFNKFVKEAVDFISSSTPAIHFETQLEPERVHVNADESQLQMVVSALVRNAVEAIGNDGDGVINISTRLAPWGDSGERSDTKEHYVCLEVSDNGCGMTKEELKRVFDPFYSTKFRGRGLDLAAVHGIVSNHNGHISVESTPGFGTRVTVYFPVSEGHVPVEVHPMEPLSGGSGTVLVVGNDDSGNELTVLMLRRLGYTPVIATTEDEAKILAENRQGAIQAALLDTDMGGGESARIYRELVRRMPVLRMLLVGSDKGVKGGTIREGVDQLISKPLCLPELAAALRGLTERRKHQRYRIHDGRCRLHGGGKQLLNMMIDISRGGMALSQTGGEKHYEYWSGAVTISAGGRFRVPDLPFRVVVGPDTDKSVNRLNLEFKELTPEQMDQMDYLIEHYSIRINEN